MHEIAIVKYHSLHSTASEYFLPNFITWLMLSCCCLRSGSSFEWLVRVVIVGDYAFFCCCNQNEEHSLSSIRSVAQFQTDLNKCNLLTGQFVTASVCYVR